MDTEDVYHVIGKMICTTLEELKNIRYTKPKATHEECVQPWEEKGYVKINDDTWRLDDPKYTTYYATFVAIPMRLVAGILTALVFSLMLPTILNSLSNHIKL